MLKLLAVLFILLSCNKLCGLENDLDPKNYFNKAEIVIIDKTLGDSAKPKSDGKNLPKEEHFIFEKNVIQKYKSLEIVVETCWTSSKDRSVHEALIRVDEITPMKKQTSDQKENQTEDEQVNKTIFHQWIFKKDRAISHLEHPIYQIYLSECKK